MVKVIVIDPQDEVILHSTPIESKRSAKWSHDFWRAEEEDRGRDLERVLICESTVRLMPRHMEIPVPVFPVLVRKGGR